MNYIVINMIEVVGWNSKYRGQMHKSIGKGGIHLSRKKLIKTKHFKEYSLQMFNQNRIKLN